MLKRSAPIGVCSAGIAALLLAGCSGDPAPDGGGDAGGELVVAALPEMMDPYVTMSRSNWMVAASVCEGLFANGANMDVHDGLAEDSTYDEGSGEYTITIRDDVPLHGGGTLTSDDVVASLERYAAGDAGALFDELVAGVEAVDATTVRITTEEPTGAIPTLLATPDTGAYIMSAAAIEAAGDDDITDLDCTGPYTLESFTVDQDAVVQRFDEYASRGEESDGAAGAKTAHADTIRFTPLNEDNVVNQLRTGQVNVAPQFVSMDQLSVYESDPALVPVVNEGAGFSLLQFNLTDGVFTDLALREAVMNAVDPEAIAMQQLGDTDYFEDISSMFPAESPWYSESGGDAWAARDAGRAAELVEDSDYDGTPVRILYRPSSDNYGPLLQQQLEAAGFAVELIAADAATFGSTRTDPSAWDIFLAGGTAYSDPLTVVFLGDDFPGWWASDEKRALVAELTAGADLEERLPVWEELQELIWTELPFVKLGHEPRLVVTSSDVSGLEPSQGTVRGFYNVAIGE